MGKVAVVGLGDRGGALLATADYYSTAPIYCLIAEECPGDFLDIHTSKAFNARGDKDCRHRSVSGLVTFSRYDVDPPAKSVQSIPEKLNFGTAGLWEPDTIWQTIIYYDAYGSVRDEHLPISSTLIVTSGGKIISPTPRSRRRRLVNYELRDLGRPVNVSTTDQTISFAVERGGENGTLWTLKCTVVNERWRTEENERVPWGTPLPAGNFVGKTESTLLLICRKPAKSASCQFLYASATGVVEPTKSLLLDYIDVPWYVSWQGVLDRVSVFLRKFCRPAMSELSMLTNRHSLTNGLKRKLVKSALDDVRNLRINSIAYLRDLTRLKELIKPILQLKKRPWLLKNWANVWLTYRYGIRLFCIDTYEILKAIQREGGKPSPLTHTRSLWAENAHTSSLGDVEVVTHCKLLFDNAKGNIPIDVTKCLRKWDLILTRENIWDFIPYSFVLDWILPVGNYLADLDSMSDLTLFKSNTAIFSRKTSYLVTSSFQHMLDIAGYWDSEEFWLEPIFGRATLVLTLTSYDRWHENPRYVISPLEFSNGLNLVRTVDAVALTVQRRN